MVENFSLIIEWQLYNYAAQSFRTTELCSTCLCCSNFIKASASSCIDSHQGACHMCQSMNGSITISLCLLHDHIISAFSNIHWYSTLRHWTCIGRLHILDYSFAESFCSVRNSDWAKVKPKSEVNFFRTQSELRTERKTELIGWSEVRTASKVNLNYPDSVQMNLQSRDRLIPYRLTFAERKTTSLFRLVQTNRIAKISDLSQRRNNY